MSILNVSIIPCLSDNYTYLIHDKSTNKVIAVDPPVVEPITNFLKKSNLNLDFILSTHHHADHVDGNLELKKIYNCKIIGFEEDSHRIPGIDIKLKNHATWKFGNETVKIEHAPGHTAGHVFYHFQRNKLVFVGDIVFPMGCGRIFEGSAKEMYESVIKIKNLSNDTKIYSGHEYTNSNSKFCLEFDKSNKELSKRSQNILSLREENKPTVPTTVQLEKETNIFFRCDNQDVKNYINMKNAKSEEVFAKLRELKDNF